MISFFSSVIRPAFQVPYGKDAAAISYQYLVRALMGLLVGLSCHMLVHQILVELSYSLLKPSTLYEVGAFKLLSSQVRRNLRAKLACRNHQNPILIVGTQLLPSFSSETALCGVIATSAERAR